MNFTSAFCPCARTGTQAAKTQITAITSANIGRFMALLRLVELRCGVAISCDAVTCRSRCEPCRTGESGGQPQGEPAPGRGQSGNAGYPSRIGGELPATNLVTVVPR